MDEIILHQSKKLKISKTLYEDLFTLVIDYLDTKSHIKSQTLSKRYLKYIYKSSYIPKEIVLYSTKRNLGYLFDIMHRYKNIQRITSKSLNNMAVVSITGNLYYK
uniref:Uncharacterized protein n=1 Tax=viral metagenome TaxID=1070528 RepID=A0A6C0J7H1_9ZZZZ